MVAGLGIDIVDLRDFRTELRDDLTRTLFLPDELDYAGTQARSWENLGARLAAKRAVFRALGADAKRPAWHDVEVLRRETGDLEVKLTGDALRRSRAIGATACRLSMTHTRETALAVAVLEAAEGSGASKGAHHREGGQGSHDT